MRVGHKGGVSHQVTPTKPKNAQITQAHRKKQKKYSNTCDVRVITTLYSNPRKESKPPLQKRAESVTEIPRKRSRTSRLAEPNSWASVALTHCAKKKRRLDGIIGISIRNTRDARVITSQYSNPRKESIPSPLTRTE